MIQTSLYTTSTPSAYISIKKNRTKLYSVNGEEVAYLPNGTEFQLEFHNDTPWTQKAEIWVNGKRQKHALVLNPWQHFYLDRFMDNDKKLKFDVYEVDNTPEVKDIIANNGYIKIQFFKQYIQPVQTFTTWGSTYPNVYFDNSGTNPTYRMNYMNASMGLTNDSISSADAPKVTGNSSTLYCSNNISIKNSVNSVRERITRGVVSEQSIETGRVAQGDKSNQSFVDVQLTFESFANTTIQYRIIPITQKPQEVNTKSIRNYCGSCGRRIKNGWVHCAGCGEKI